MAIPDEPFMTACQVITWIAFGTSLRKEELGSLGLETVDTGVKGDGQYKLRETAVEIMGDVADLDRAEEELRKAVSAERLVAYGVQGRPAPSRATNPIPFSVFMSRGDRNGEHSSFSRQMIFTWWDTVESEAAPAAYSEVQFKTAEVAVIWPSNCDAPDRSSNEISTRVDLAGRPSSAETITRKHNRRGPKPTKTNDTIKKMLKDYSNKEALETETEELLSNRYEVSRDTARKARMAVICQMETPT